MFGERVAILDEPTAALGMHESAMAKRLVRSPVEHGLPVVMITHDMRHVPEYRDRVMVLRLGRHVAAVPIWEVDGDRLVSFITGASEGIAARARRPSPPRPAVLGALHRTFSPTCQVLATLPVIYACGTTVVLISGGLDMSVGPIFAVVA